MRTRSLLPRGARFVSSFLGIAVVLGQLFLPSAEAARLPTGFELLIDCGSTVPYLDTQGRTWQADAFYTGGTEFNSNHEIHGTNDDDLYRYERNGPSFSYNIPIADGGYEVTLHLVEQTVNGPGLRIFDVDIEGTKYIDDLDIYTLLPKNTAYPLTFIVAVADGSLDFDFVASVGNAQVSGIEVHEHESGDPFLHVTIDGPTSAVDYDGDGVETVTLIGSGSHTHELGRNLVSFTWSENSIILGTTPDITLDLAVGSHTITLEIGDDDIPPKTLQGTWDVRVDSIDSVGGALARYFVLSGSTGPGGRARQGAVYMEVLDSLVITTDGTSVGGSGLLGSARVVLDGQLDVPTAATYDFQLVGGQRGRVLVDGGLVSGPLALAAGSHALRAILVVQAVIQLPMQVEVSIDGGAWQTVDSSQVNHDQTRLRPFLNSYAGTGSALGGETIVLPGLAFFPADQVAVHWGSSTMVEPQITVAPESISFVAPPGSGTIQVRVATPNGLSNPGTYTYEIGQAPILFSTQNLATGVTGATVANFGPDGRLYVGTVSGTLYIYEFDDDYGIVSTQVVSTLTGLSNTAILGLCFNPFDPPDPPRIYIAHGELFANGGACFSGSSPYSGQVTVLDGPNFDTIQPLITGLPVSNHDHSVNEMFVDNQGDLMILVGGNTNAGVPACNIGDLPESPLSGALLRARISDPFFNGVIDYWETGTAFLNNDQVFGDLVDVAPGVDIELWATGLRNAFGMVFTTQGRVYCNDNGPNSGFGPASTGPDTESPDPQTSDRLSLLVEGHYYGHPNRNRGRYDLRENIYHLPNAPDILGQYTSQIRTDPSSINGITEYRATTFGDAMRGSIVYQKWNTDVWTLDMADQWTPASQTKILNAPTALDILHGPGGVLIGIDYSQNKIELARPTDLAVSGQTAYDIFPWRGRTDGTTPFVIGGENFATLAETQVTIGGLAATLTSVSPTRIHGFVPANPSPSAVLLDVVVTNTSTVFSNTIPEAFRYVFDAGVGSSSFEIGPPASLSLGEVSCAAIRGVLYVVGEGQTNTLAYNPAKGTWVSNLAVRPLPGHHHSCEVIGNKMYLFGGLGGGSEGTVQIYDPELDSWSLGAPIPSLSGSASSALIDELVYFAGGIVSGSTVTDAHVYDPVADSWTAIAPMPVGRNHTAAATDGQRFFIFGGRGPGSGDDNVVAEGFDDVLIYDPLTDTWEASFDLGSTIPPLPQKRGGTGRSVYFRGEFYVIGGETTPSGTGQQPGDVYNRIDIYDPLAQTWRLDATPLPTARHGIYPVILDGRIWIACGGVQAANSQSQVLEILSR